MQKKFYYAFTEDGIKEIGKTAFTLRKIASVILAKDDDYKEVVFEDYGGMIVCSTDVNSNAERGIMSFLKSKWETLLNRIFNVKRVKDVVQLFQTKKGIVEIGYSQGNLFHGKYIDKENNQEFNEKSFAIDLRGLNFETVKQLAVDVCKRFNQQSVMVVNHENNKTSLIFP